MWRSASISSSAAAGRSPRPAHAILSRYRETGWHREQGQLTVGDAKRALLHHVLVLNRGKTIGPDRIREILAGVAGKNRRLGCRRKCPKAYRGSRRRVTSEGR